MENRHVFSIAQKENPLTGKPFGDQFAGSFTIRRPTIGDKMRIELRDAASMNAYGSVHPQQITEGTRLICWAFATLSVVGEERPEWFDQERLHSEDDEVAVLAVYQEVAAWLATFRRREDPTAGGGASA